MSKAEKFIDLNTKTYSNVVSVKTPHGKEEMTEPWITPDQALRAVEIAREEMLNDICEWIDINYVHYLNVSAKGTLTANIRQFIGNLKQAMKDEMDSIFTSKTSIKGTKRNR